MPFKQMGNSTSYWNILVVRTLSLSLSLSLSHPLPFLSILFITTLFSIAMPTLINTYDIISILYYIMPLKS